MRVALAFFSLPLCAFSCVSMSTLEVRPASRSAIDPGFRELVDRYADVQRTVDEWAKQQALQRRECSDNFVPTPLCKTYYAENNEVTVKFDAQSNYVDIVFWGPKSKELGHSLQAVIRANGQWSVRDKYARQ